jgi:hypothetical protein
LATGGYHTWPSAVTTSATGGDPLMAIDSKGTVEIVLVDGGNEFYSLRTDPFTQVGLFSANKKQFPDR